jgi:hypothetical protein
MEHESKIKVNLELEITVPTESHPDDIDDETMKDIINNYLYDELNNFINYGDLWALFNSIKSWEIKDTEVIEDSEVE